MERKIEKKISKGYRLKQETHDLIKQIQNAIMGNTDEAINMACRKFLSEYPKKKNPEILINENE